MAACSKAGRVSARWALRAPDLGEGAGAPAVGCVRPHDIWISREREADLCVPAVVKDILRAGSLVRVEREGDDRNEIQAELTRSGAQHLILKLGEQVFVCPRNVRVFLDTA